MQHKFIEGGCGHLFSIPNVDIDYIGYFGANDKKDTVESILTAQKRIKHNGKNPDLIINAEFFNMNTGKPSSAVVDDGEVQLLTEYWGVAFVQNKTPVFSYKNNANAPDYVGFYPRLVQAGKVFMSAKDGSTGLTGSRARTAVGFSDKEFYVLVTPESGGCTLEEAAQHLIDAGAINGGNFDGGASTQYITPYGSNYTGRKVRGFVALWLTDKARSSIDVYPAVATKKLSVCNANGVAESGRYISSGDTILVKKALQPNLLIEIQYPLSKGGVRTAYLKSFDGLKMPEGY